MSAVVWLALTLLALVVLGGVAAHLDDRDGDGWFACGCRWPAEDDDCDAVVVCTHGRAWSFRAWTDRTGRVRDAWDEATVVRAPIGPALTVLPCPPTSGADPDPIPGQWTPPADGYDWPTPAKDDAEPLAA